MEDLKDKDFRHSYMESHVKRFLAAQMKSLRGDKSQKEFAEILDTDQSTVSSRYENSEYGKNTLQTLLDIAEKLDIALVARFVSFPEFFKITSDYSDEAYAPSSYEHKQIESLTGVETKVTIRNPALSRPFEIIPQVREAYNFSQVIYTSTQNMAMAHA